MSRIFAITNQKGGVGKTTTAVNLAAALAGLGWQVLLVDIDPQANATASFGLQRPDPDRTVYGLLLNPSLPAPIVEAAALIDLVPSSPDLAGAELELVQAPDRELRLKRGLGAIGGGYDVTLIDCPPSLGLLTLNALVAAEGAVVPIQCEYLALEGLSQVSRTLSLVRHQVNPSLRLAGVLMTMYDRRTNLASDVVADVQEHFPREIFQTFIPRSVRLSEAPSHGLTIFAYDAKRSPGSSSLGAQAYQALALEFAAREGLPRKAPV